MSAQTQDQRIEKINEWYKLCVGQIRDFKKKMLESFRFYTGIEQWEINIKEELRKQGRPALQINRCLSTINAIAGYERQNKRDVRLYPRRGGTAAIAAAVTELIKYTMDVTRGNYEKSDSFLDGLVGGKGWLSASINYNSDPLNGDIEIKKESPFDIIEDQSNRSYNLNRCKYIFKLFWYDKKQIELMYKVEAKDLPETMNRDEGVDESEFEQGTEDYDGDEELVEDKGKDKYLIKECWWKEWELATFALDTRTGEIKRIERADNIKQLKEMVKNGNNPFLGWFERPVEVLFKSVLCNDIELEYKKNPLNGITLYPFFRFCAYWADGEIIGLLDNIKDPQRELNKRRSQTLHLLNQHANAGLKVGRDGFSITPEVLRKLELYGSKPGMVWNMADYGGVIERDEPAQLSQGHFLLSEAASNDIPRISGINTDLLGTREANESGRARQIRQEAGLSQVATVFDNFARTQESLGEFLFEIIRNTNIYSDEEIIQVIGQAKLKEFMVTDPETEEPTGKIDLEPLRNWKSGRYGIKIGEAPTTPTLRMENFENLMKMAQTGFIPPSIAISASDLPDKEGMLEQIQAQGQREEKVRQENMQLEQSKLEIKKYEIDMDVQIEREKIISEEHIAFAKMAVDREKAKADKEKKPVAKSS